MTLPAIIAIALVFLVVFIAFLTVIDKYKKNYSIILTQNKNNAFVLSLLKELQSNYEHGKNIGDAADILIKSLGQHYSISAISCLFRKEGKFIFKSEVHENINHAFTDHIKDTLHHIFKADIKNQKPDTEGVDLETIEEKITGIPFDEVSTSVIKSTLDLKITTGSETILLINLASTSENQYAGDDVKKTSTMISELVSGFLTRLKSHIDIERGKALATIDSFSEGIFMIDKNHNLNTINNSARNVLSVHRPNPTINDLLSSLPNTYNFKEKIDKAMQEKKPIEETNVPIRDKIFKITITPVIETNSGKNEVIGCSVILADITSEKSLIQMKEDFTNVMVHELRSPLTAIMAASEFLLSQADLNNSEKDKLMHMISESSKRMLDEIALILDSAKMDAGLFQVRKAPTDLRKLIMERVNVFTPLATEKAIGLKVDIDPSLNTFSFDPIRIDEVINNLLSNSLKFTEPQGTINLSVHTLSDKVIVAVSDTGKGIPKDKQHLLFSKFQQGRADNEHQGTGLGLYVVKGVVEAHGGSIKLESEEGKGTTISFILPLDASYKPLPGGTNPPAPEHHDPQKLVN